MGSPPTWSASAADRSYQRIVTAIVLLPILFLAAWEGGWYLIPADLAWLAIEILDREPAERPAPSGAVLGRPD